MELPEPIMPGRYSAEQIREMLGLKTRQAVSFIALKEKWEFIKLGPAKLYSAEQVTHYVTKAEKEKMEQEAFEATLKPDMEVRLRWRGGSVPATVEKVNKSSIAVRVKEPVGKLKTGDRAIVSRVTAGRWSAANCVRPMDK